MIASTQIDPAVIDFLEDLDYNRSVAIQAILGDDFERSIKHIERLIDRERRATRQIEAAPQPALPPAESERIEKLERELAETRKALDSANGIVDLITNNTVPIVDERDRLRAEVKKLQAEIASLSKAEEIPPSPVDGCSHSAVSEEAEEPIEVGDTLVVAVKLDGSDGEPALLCRHKPCRKPVDDVEAFGGYCGHVCRKRAEALAYYYENKKKPQKPAVELKEIPCGYDKCGKIFKPKKARQTCHTPHCQDLAKWQRRDQRRAASKAQKKAEPKAESSAPRLCERCNENSLEGRPAMAKFCFDCRHEIDKEKSREYGAKIRRAEKESAEPKEPRLCAAEGCDASLEGRHHSARYCLDCLKKRQELSRKVMPPDSEPVENKPTFEEKLAAFVGKVTSDDDEDFEPSAESQALRAKEIEAKLAQGQPSMKVRCGKCQQILMVSRDVKPPHFHPWCKPKEGQKPNKSGWQVLSDSSKPATNQRGSR